MAFKALPEQQKVFLTVVVLLGCLACMVLCETGDCGQQEFRDRSGNCALCQQCGPGMELSKECGFGYGEDAQCVRCRPHRFKEDWGFQKCKPCLDCALLSRFQKANCSATSDAVCGDCLPGFYRKTKLVGFQDLECVPCGDPPPPYEPLCASRVNLVRIPSTASSPRDTALAAVICGALATVLLALIILCVIYCKRQFMEKKPSWSLRAQDLPYTGSELSCFDRPRLGACAQCRGNSAQTCGPVHLIPSRCCDGACGAGQGTPGCWVHSEATLEDRSVVPGQEAVPPSFGSLSRSLCGECADAWPLMQSPGCAGDASSCDSYPDLPGEDAGARSPGSASVSSLDTDRRPAPGGGAVRLPARPGHFADGAELSRHSSLPEPVLTRAAAPAASHRGPQGRDVGSRSPQTGLQDAAERTCFFLQ